MSLIQTQTTTLLGIGTGGVNSVQDFAAGVRERRKGRSIGYVTEDAQGRAIANPDKQVTIKPNDPSYKKAERKPNEIPKVQMKLKQSRPVQDPKQTHKRELAMTTDDRTLIQGINQLEARIGGYGNEIGKSATKKLKKEVQGLLTLAANSSRGGLADVWSEVHSLISREGGRHAGKSLSRLRGAFASARAATNKVLDTTVDLDKYEFAAGRAKKLTIADENAYAQQARQRGWGAQAKTIGALENKEYLKAAKGDLSTQRYAKDWMLTEGKYSMRDLMIASGGGSVMTDPTSLAIKDRFRRSSGFSGRY